PATPVLGAPGALLVIISGPSGVGKDTIIDALKRRARERDYHFAVTCTTRGRGPARSNRSATTSSTSGSSRRCATLAASWRRTRCTATGMGRHGPRWPERLLPAAT